MAGAYVQSAFAVALRYLVRFSVVPESSERWKAWIARSGSLAPGFSLAMASSFHLVILPLKILARDEASRTRLSTPSTWKPIAIGPPTIGRLMPWPPVQTFLESSTCWALSGESEPAKATVPWVKATMPSPEEEDL